MCGINGMFDLKNRFDQEELHRLIHVMNEQIIYRGPDHEGIYQDGGLVMGMRRLSVIDLASGNQPVWNEDKSIAVVFNGEIYNFQELRKKLQGKHRFYTTSDTEVIVHAYEEYGTDMLERLDGMFAFSLFDKKTQTLVLARDRMGEKPLYYFKNEEMFLWGSELKSLLATGLVAKKISHEALNQYLQLTYIPAPLTIYDGIYKLLPGHFLVVQKDGTIEKQSYWDITKIPKEEKLTYRAAQKKLYRLFEKSVRERMVSDVPVGAFLSGGVDSGSVVGMMSKVSGKPIETFTIGFREKDYDERSRARMVSAFNKTKHHEYLLDYKDVLKVVDLILGSMDEPFADSSVLPTYYVSKFAGKHVKVVLTGDAGDELFMGYDKYLIGYYSKILHRFPAWMIRMLKKFVYSIPDKAALVRKMKKVLENSEKTGLEQRMALMSLGFNGEEREELLVNGYYDKRCMDFIRDQYYRQKNVSELTRTQYTDLSVVLEGDMLAKVDRMSMLNSLETRTPLLSKEIVEFAYSLPDHYKIRGKRLKCIMKDTFEGILPKGSAKRRKSGFGIPIDHWFRDDRQLKGLLTKLLNREMIEQQGIFRWDYIGKILEEHISGKVNHKSKIWTLFVFQKWYLEHYL